MVDLNELVGRWEWRPRQDVAFSDGSGYLKRSNGGDPSSPVLFLQPDGVGRVANLGPEYVGDWWIMQGARIGAMFAPPEPPTRLVLARTYDQSRGMNYYYHDYRAQFTVHPDHSVTWGEVQHPPAEEPS